MADSSDTGRIIPCEVQARDRWTSIDQVCEVVAEEEENTYPIGSLKEEGIYFVEGNTGTLIILRDVPPSLVGTAEAYTNMFHKLGSKWETSVGTRFLDWAVCCGSENLTLSMPLGVSYTVDSRVEGIESEEVKRFCEEHGLLQYLTSAVDIARKCFPNIQKLSLGKEEDPESDEEWIVIDITVVGEIEEVLENYNNYITMFVSGIPWPERERIILSYNIL